MAVAEPTKRDLEGAAKYLERAVRALDRVRRRAESADQEGEEVDILAPAIYDSAKAAYTAVRSVEWWQGRPSDEELAEATSRYEAAVEAPPAKCQGSQNPMDHVWNKNMFCEECCVAMRDVR